MNAPRYATLALCTIALGLLVQSGATMLPPSLRDATGDALWAMMIAWWVAAAHPTASLPHRLGTALILCFGVEFSQLYHSPALDSLRQTVPGRLVLGSGFDRRDLAAYAAGVLAAGAVERLIIRGAMRAAITGARRT